MIQDYSSQLERITALCGFEKDATLTPFGNGLINHTWKITDGTDAYILQQINQQVFNNLQAIAQNISRISVYLSQQAPHYLFPALIEPKNQNGVRAQNQMVLLQRLCEKEPCFKRMLMRRCTNPGLI